ncbi:ABC transporter permease [Polynucleobacter sp. Fuers-14]|uniref:ABC transporter permease n=1 Tax=Polynucleobacter sp. Fuers-14 TaxID=1758364 RepID=UPI001C0C6179|nr:ABC transporter permease [Polynucleobacter sp. Fuers-14]MBU3641080.1 ABC transporter permease [Polynucleobacter sp. Fuers-14]
MQNFSFTPKAMFNSFWINRSLIKVLVKREVLGRYKGSIFGILWPFLNPIFMLIVYTFVFSVVFKARWSGGTDSQTEFALVLFAGLIVFNLFAECLNRSPGLILQNVNYVKRVIFPLEILPIVSLGSSLFHAIISYVIWLVAYILFYGAPHITVLLIPLIILPLLFLTLGLTWIFASLGVYLRDMTQLVGVMTTVLMFLSPIFYPVDSLPEKFQAFVSLNPLASVIQQSRQALFWGGAPDLFEYLTYLLGSFFISLLGFIWFQKSRKGFADVI